MIELAIVLGLYFIGWKYFWPRYSDTTARRIFFVVMFVLFGGLLGIFAIFGYIGQAFSRAGSQVAAEEKASYEEWKRERDSRKAELIDNPLQSWQRPRSSTPPDSHRENQNIYRG